MYKSTLILLIGVACVLISVLAEYGTRGKSMFPVFRRVRELSGAFFWGLLAMRYEKLWFAILSVALIVYIAARSEGADQFRKDFRRFLRYVFRRNAPSNSQK